MAFLVVEMLDEHAAVRGEGADEMVTAIGGWPTPARPAAPQRLCKGTAT